MDDEDVRDGFLSTLDSMRMCCDPHAKLASIVEVMVTSRQLRVGMIVPVSEPTFTMTKGPFVPIPVIMFPFDFLSRPLGIRVFHSVGVCSMATDYLYGRFLGELEHAKLRAESLQADWVREGRLPLHGLENRIVDLLARFPQGIETPSVKHLFYEHKAIDSLVD